MTTYTLTDIGRIGEGIIAGFLVGLIVRAGLDANWLAAVLAFLALVQTICILALTDPRYR
jgi:uncharacterized membrane protein